MEDKVKNESNQFMNFLNDPSQIVKTNGFSIGTASAQFIALILFAIVGASIQFRFENIRDIWNLDYWISVIVLLVEQLYAYNIGYDLGKSLSLNANNELKTTNEQIEDLIEGVYDEKTNAEIIKPLKRDSSYIEPALEVLMNEEKVRLVQKRMKEIIGLFDSKLDYFLALKKKRFFFPKKIVIAKHKVKWFWKRSSAIDYCNMQIANGKRMLNDKEVILAVPDNNVAGFQRYTYADIISSQNEKLKENVSKYYQKNEGVIRTKMYGKKAITKILMSMIGPAILFGALFENSGMVAYSIFLLAIQLANGFKFGANMVISVVLYNAVNRLQAIRDLPKVIASIKSQEKEKLQEPPKNNVKLDNDELDILPPLKIA
jgi:hypothetical protein